MPLSSIRSRTRTPRSPAARSRSMRRMPASVVVINVGLHVDRSFAPRRPVRNACSSANGPLSTSTHAVSPGCAANSSSLTASSSEALLLEVLPRDWQARSSGRMELPCPVGNAADHPNARARSSSTSSTVRAPTRVSVRAVNGLIGAWASASRLRRCYVPRCDRQTSSTSIGFSMNALQPTSIARARSAASACALTAMTGGVFRPRALRSHGTKSQPSPSGRRKSSSTRS